MTVAKLEHPDAVQRLGLQEVDAWMEYLETTRELEVPFRYEEVEPWAYARLGRRLARIQEQRREIEEDDSA